MTSSRPLNILIFIPNDLGDTLHCFGHEDVRSPNLDRLADRGVRFTDYFCASPECSPSRGAMMTGYHPHQNGMMGLANFGWNLRKPHLARRLSDLGYETHLFGFQHEAHGPPESLGYGHVHVRESLGDKRFAVETVCEDVSAFLSGPGGTSDRTWFAYAGFYDVHRPWPPETSFAANEVRVPPYLPDNPTIRKDLCEFYGNIERMDEAVGRALDALAASPAASRTLVVFTTDHGPAFPRAKATLYDPGLRIPLIMHWPGRIEGGGVRNQLLCNVDFTPTVLDLAGARSEETFAGRSFAGLLAGWNGPPRDQVVASLLYDVAYDPMHAVRTRTHKYIRSFAATAADAQGADPETLATHAAGQWIRVDDFDVMSSPAWESMAGNCTPPPREELYDLRDDPWEQRNLVGDPLAAGVLEDMRNRLREWMLATGSPLLHGHVPPLEEQREAARRYRPGGPMYRKTPS